MYLAYHAYNFFSSKYAIIFNQFQLRSIAFSIHSNAIDKTMRESFKIESGETWDTVPSGNDPQKQTFFEMC